MPIISAADIKIMANHFKRLDITFELLWERSGSVVECLTRDQYPYN